MTDYFTILGVPKTFIEKDAAQLERRFHDLQRRFHPDRASVKGDAALSEALEQSSRINQAYRTLRDPLERTKYLLSLYGYSVEGSKQVPMDLLELVMNVQEQVAMLEMGAKESGDFSMIKRDLATRSQALESEINRLKLRWDELPDHSDVVESLSTEEKNIFESLTKLLASGAYLRTLEATLEAAKEGKSQVLKH